MSHTEIMNVQHPDYTATIDQVNLVRDALEGSNAIKNGERANDYLPNPTDMSTTEGSDIAAADYKYKLYKNMAEYDAFPGRTKSGYMGALKSTVPEIKEIPSIIDYILTNSDGSGLSLLESIEIAQSEVLAMNFTGLLSDFTGLASMEQDGEGKAAEITRQKAKAMGITATIKHYPRESIVDWDFSVIDGVEKLSFVKLSESSSEIDKETLQRVVVENQLILALDEDGNYYQQQIIKNGDGKGEVSDKKYVTNSNGQMKDIPFTFVITEKQAGEKIPRELGSLYPICLKAISRYQLSAELHWFIYKAGQPTIVVEGLSQAGYEQYKKMNGSGLFLGGVVSLPEKVKLDYLTTNSESTPIFQAMEENQKEAKAMGARFDTSEAKDEAVGVAKLRSAEELSALMNVQESIKEGFTKALTWCYWFMTTDKKDPEIELVLNKEFNKVKISPQEQTAIQNSVQFGIIDHKEALNQLEKGGVLTEDAETILSRMDLGDVNLSGLTSQND